MELAPRTVEDQPTVSAFLADHGSLRVARDGELVDPLEHPAVLAFRDGRLVGVATYVVEADSCELLTLHTSERQTGVGSALVAAVHDLASEAGCRRLWVVTTNDNLGALRFYQRRGFRLAALRPGAVDASRALLKPEIPSLGNDGIPLRDEIELQLDLSLDAGS